MMKKKSPPNANTPTQYRSSLSLIVILPVFECSKDLHRRCRLRPLGTPLLLDHGHVSLMYIRVEQIIVFIEFIVRVLFTTQHIRIDTFQKTRSLVALSFPFLSIPSTYRNCCFKAKVQLSILKRLMWGFSDAEWYGGGQCEFSLHYDLGVSCLWVNKRYLRSMYSTIIFFNSVELAAYLSILSLFCLC